MIFRQLTPNGDWTFGKGVANYAQNQDAIALNILTSVKSWVGDCFFSLQFGINWKQLMNTGQQSNLNAALQNLLLRTYGVVSIVSSSVNFNPNTRLFSASYTVNTVYSQTVVDQVNILTGPFGS